MRGDQPGRSSPEVVGEWQAADAAIVEKALQQRGRRAARLGRARPPPAAPRSWNTPPTCWKRACREFIALCVKEAGKTIPDGVAEVREAVDFLRYYAAQARAQFARPSALPGPTGESNQLQLHGRGVFVCISPWNFPLAIFMGQVAAALAAGNSVIAKPAEQTNLIGYAAVQAAARSRRAGRRAAVPARRRRHGRRGTDRAIRASPASRSPAPPTPRARSTARWPRAMRAIGALIAETGGQNALIADSSALPEQLVKDAIGSAFTSAGQRCSAARVLFVQDDIADKVISMLAGAMAELMVGDPGLLSTDVGPVIDADALKMLEDHAERMDREAKLIRRAHTDSAPGARHASSRRAPGNCSRSTQLHQRDLRPGPARDPLEGRASSTR